MRLSYQTIHTVLPAISKIMCNYLIKKIKQRRDSNQELKIAKSERLMNEEQEMIADDR